MAIRGEKYDKLAQELGIAPAASKRAAAPVPKTAPKPAPVRKQPAPRPAHHAPRPQPAARRAAAPVRPAWAPPEPDAALRKKSTVPTFFKMDEDVSRAVSYAVDTYNVKKQDVINGALRMSLANELAIVAEMEKGWDDEF